MNEELAWSIVVTIHNGIPLAKKCIDSILSSDYQNYEIICVDSGSTDGTVNYLRSEYGSIGSIKVVASKNVGAGGGYNLGAKAAVNDLLIFLNFDTIVDREWLRKISNVFENDDSVAMAQAMILDMKTGEETIQCAGIYMIDYCGWTWSYLKGSPYRDYPSLPSGRAVEIGIASGTALAVRRKVFERLGGFDDSFFMYFEETDLCWRAQLAGYKVTLVPEAKVYHLGGDVRKYTHGQGLRKTVKNFHSHKNSLRMLLKNYSAANLVKFAPTIIVIPLLLRLYDVYKVGDYHSVGSMLKALIWTMANLGDTLTSRRKVQQMRAVSDTLVLTKISKRLPLSSMIGIIEGKRSILKGTQLYSRLGKNY